MATDRPVSEESMLQVNGVGRVKMENYGHDFISEIVAFTREQQGNREKEKGATHLVSLELLQEGLSPEQIADQRGMHPTTIYSHIASLYEQGHLRSLDAFVNEQELQAIGDALYVHGMDSPLKLLFDSLHGKYPFHKIRLAIAHYKKKGMSV